MPIQRVAVIFDDQARPETTGVYCLRALRNWSRRSTSAPPTSTQAPRQGFDLYLNVDDGLDYRLPSDLRPRSLVGRSTRISTSSGTEPRRPTSTWCSPPSATGPKGCAARGSPLHPGCRWPATPTSTPGTTWRRNTTSVSSATSSPARAPTWSRYCSGSFPRMFVGRRYFEEMARTYSASRLVFNRSVRNDVNMRVFEAVACGSLLMTNDLADNGQAELFRDGVHLATYRDADELLDKVRFYLAREESRERIAAAGRAEALAKHTYRHRMEAAAGRGGARLARKSL